jgi:hypothetical protein
MPTLLLAVRAGFVVELIRRFIVKCRVWPELVVLRELPLQSCLGSADAIIGMQIDILVLNATPQPFHKHVVPPAAFPIHADLDSVILQQPGKFQTGELAALVGVDV